MSGLKQEINEYAFEQLFDFLKKIEKDFKNKKAVYNNLLELNKTQKENLKNIFDAKVVSIVEYKKLKNNLEKSEELIMQYKTEIPQISTRIENLKKRLKLSKETPTLGKLYNIPTSAFKRQTRK